MPKHKPKVTDSQIKTAMLQLEREGKGKCLRDAGGNITGFQINDRGRLELANIKAAN